MIGIIREFDAHEILDRMVHRRIYHADPGQRTRPEEPYNQETKFTIQNKPGSNDDVIVGRKVTCLGSFNNKSQLMATRVEIRSR